MKKYIYIAILFLTFFVSVDAQAQVYLEQGKITHSVKQGENLSGKVVVHNTTDKPVDLTVYWEDFIYDEPYDGTKKFFAQGTAEESMGGWINFFPKELTLAPFEHKSISYTINTPASISSGNYGVLFFENDTSRVEETTGLNVVTRVGCLFFVEPVNKSKTLSAESFDFLGQTLKIAVKNTGNVTVIPDGTYYIIDQEGLIVDRGKMEKLYLPSLKQADLEIKFNKQLDRGLYNMVLTFDLQDNDVLVKELDFEIDSDDNASIKSVRD